MVLQSNVIEDPCQPQGLIASAPYQQYRTTIDETVKHNKINSRQNWHVKLVKSDLTTSYMVFERFYVITY